MDWISTDEAAKLLNVTPARIRQLLTDKRIKAAKVGKAWLVSRKSAMKFKQFEQVPPGRPRKEPVNTEVDKIVG